MGVGAGMAFLPNVYDGAYINHFVYIGPGSFIEVRKILPLLTTTEPENPSFHVVALGLPNFGFSQGVSSQGFGIPQYAEVLFIRFLSPQRMVM